jgi:hypothetical protein
VGGGRMWEKGIGKWIWSKYYVHMYVNGKNVEIIRAIRGERNKGE